MMNRTEVLTTGSRSTNWFRLALLAVLVLATGVKTILLLRSYGFEQGDPLEYINIAHAIAYHTGEEWWDIRPVLFSILLVPTIWIGSILPEPTGEAAVRLLRSVPLVFSLLAILLTAVIGRDLGGNIAGISGALLLTANAGFNALSVSTFAEIPSTAGILAATLITLRSRSSWKAHLVCGLILGLSVMIRYQSLAFVPAFGLWALVRGGFRPALALGLGFSVSAALQALLDQFAYGSPFHSLIESARYNVTSDEASRFYGSEPVTWYILTVGDWLGYVAVLLAALGVVRAARKRQSSGWLFISVAGGTMLVWLSLLGHKELRFMAQVAPFLALFAGNGVAFLCTTAARGGVWAGGGLLAVAMGLGLWQTATLPLRFNIGFVDGPKAVAAARPGATLATIPWFIARPYADGKLQLVRGDVDRWRDRDLITRTFTEADYILLREYDFATDRTIQRLVDTQYRTIETYPDQIVLLENRRLSNDIDRNSRPRR